MSRNIGAANVTEVEAAGLSPVTLVKLDFGTPVYVQSGVGIVTYSGNDYIGVGAAGAIEVVREQERVAPAPIRLSLSIIDSDHLTEALDASHYGDEVTVYEGYLDANGDLVTTPWTLFRGYVEHAALELDGEDRVIITVQSNLTRLSEKSGKRFTTEDQEQEFSGDTGFSFVHQAIDRKLLWGARNPSRERIDDETQPPPAGREAV